MSDVLYVDADREARYAIARFLRRAAPTREMETLAEARAALLEATPSLVVVDPDLPDGDGAELIAEVRARDPWVQILAALGPDRADDAGLFISAGASDVALKPFDVGGLGVRVKRLLAAAEKEKKHLQVRHDLERRLQHAERIATLGTLCATVAHEVANPLSLVVANTGVIQRTLANEPALTRGTMRQDAREALELVGEAARDIQIAGDMIDAVVTRIRLFSRRNEERRVEGPIGECVRTALLFVKQRLDGRRVRLVESSAESPRAPHFPIRLTQAIINVLNNAIDATPVAGTVAIEWVERPDAVGLVVDDEGPGLPPDLDAESSETFFTTKPDGTGIGLLVIRSILREHGGRFDLGPRPGGHQGTRARLLVPRDPEAPLLPS